MVRSFFTREIDADARAAEAGGFDAEVWGQLEEMGLALLTTPESRGGSDATWAEAATLLHAVGRYGIAVPYAEHDLLASWLAERAGLPAIEGVTSLVLATAPVAAGDVVAVPGGAAVERVLVVSNPTGDAAGAWAVQDLAADGFAAAGDGAGSSPDAPGSSLDVRVTADTASTPLDDALGRELMVRGALARSLQIVGALERCVDEAVEHATVRIQFGRPLSRFQAVQALLAEAAAETAVAAAATEAAVNALLAAGEVTGEVERAVAVAKSVSAHAVDPVTRNAHQTLGAMGTTLEHRLHRFTLPPLRWRFDFGSARHWDRRLALAAVEAAAGEGGLWASLARV
ncbi:MAG: acyl-CoA dehydrogenase family protein [Leucobacter sp.]